MGHFTYWRYSRPVSANFSTRSSPIGDFCSVRSSLGIPVGSRSWRVGPGCSFSPVSGCETMLSRAVISRCAAAPAYRRRRTGSAPIASYTETTVRRGAADRAANLHLGYLHNLKTKTWDNADLRVGANANLDGGVKMAAARVALTLGFRFRSTGSIDGRRMAADFIFG